MVHFTAEVCDILDTTVIFPLRFWQFDADPFPGRELCCSYIAYDASSCRYLDNSTYDQVLRHRSLKEILLSHAAESNLHVHSIRPFLI